jgi:hypothetical protein
MLEKVTDLITPVSFHFLLSHSFSPYKIQEITPRLYTKQCGEFKNHRTYEVGGDVLNLMLDECTIIVQF